MNRNSVTCLIVTLFIFVLAAQNTRADISPADNPALFRQNIQQEISIPESNRPFAIPDIQPLSLDYQEKASTFDDLLVSESVGPANFVQDNAEMAALKGGRTVAVWEDNRFGAIGILLQIFDNDGNTIGANTALITGHHFDLSSPDICADTNGNFYVIWREEINGHLQAARFDSLANVLTPVFYVTDTLQSGYAGRYDADCMPDGRLLIAWEFYAPIANIYFQLYAINGIPSTTPAVANSDGLPVDHWAPAVAAEDDGDFALLWEDYRNGAADMFFRRFNTLGLPYAAEFSISDVAARDSARYLPSLAFSSSNGYLAAWADLRDKQNIYMQRLTAAGTLNGENVLLTSSSPDLPNWEIDLSVNSAGNFLAAWTIYTGENAIMIQRFGSGVTFDGAPQVVSNASIEKRYKPSIAGNSSGNSSLIWTDLIDGSSDIYAAVVGSDGSPVLSAAKINDDASGSPSFEPIVVDFGNYEWNVLFTDMRRDDGDIMLQRVYVGGELIDVNRMLNTDPPGGFQSQPSAAYQNEKMIVCWTDEREGAISGQNIFCRFSIPQYDLTDEIVANDDAAGSSAHYKSDCAINGNNVSLVVWTDTRSGLPKIYGQLFGQDYQKIGANFLIGPSAPAETGETAKVSNDNSGNFIISYLNPQNANGPSIEFKRVTPSGTVSDLFEFASDQSGYQIDDFDAGLNTDDDIIVAWHGVSASGPELFMTVFDYSGLVVASTLTLTDNSDAMPETPDLAVDDLGYVLVTWIDHRTGFPSPFRQIFNSTFSPLQTNLPVYFTAGTMMQHPATAGFKGKGIFVWADARVNGLNIYASQEVYEPTGTDDDNALLPVQFDLQQNYPNPFNPTTAIKFSLAKGGHVRLEVFNLLGQKVRTLIDDDFSAGNHSVIWDGSDNDGHKVSSGIYLYRLVNGNESRARKMTLIK